MILSIIIVSYNTKDILRNCLQSIREQKNKKLFYEIIVVDNASRDGSGEMVQKEFPSVKLIKNAENVGFAKANNAGIKQAKGKYILFLNSDTQIVDHALSEMVSFLDFHDDAGAVTCFVALPNGQLDDAAHRGFPTPWNAFCHFTGLGKLFPHSLFFNGYHLGWKDIDKVHRIDVLAGACMMVRKTAGISAGWWDEDYFFYGEDIDFCYMLKQKGWNTYFLPSAKIIHYKGVSSGIKSVSQSITKATEESKKRVQKARFSAMRIFYRKHYAAIYPKILTDFILFGIYIKEKLTVRKAC